jgi:3',5'-cyclic AMP phosphodiesterase CpdA
MVPRSTFTRRVLAPILLVAIACAAVAASAAFGQTLGKTTAQTTLVPGPPLDPAKPSFVTLTGTGPPAVRILRQLPRAKAQSRRERRRRSLAYFAQLTDFQLADEESPARLELNWPLIRGSSSWRPQEALMPQTVDASIRQLDHFTTASPDRGAKGRRAPMDFALLTGDQADNQQQNEVTWVRQIVEGGQTVDPNSGSRDYSDCNLLEKASLNRRPDDEAQRYSGVQDYNDYNGGSGDSNFYDPNQPSGPTFTSWPRYPGLMDRAQRPFTALGLRRGSTSVPTYVANGNHDGLVQGNQTAVANAERVATACYKHFATNPPQAFMSPAAFALPTGFAVPPDERRRFVDRIELKRIYGAGTQADAHGFDFVNPVENQDSGYSASYYAWDPKPGLRFIALDTISEGGAVVGSPQGNIDDPQFRWLQAELVRAKAERKVVVVFGHHPIRSLVSGTPDEAAPRCTGSYGNPNGSYSGTTDRHGHDRNPGCDIDPRSSSPIHLGGELAQLLTANPNVIAYVAGHTHASRVTACGTGAGCGSRGNWWEITTAATADWPQQSRLLEIMDNRDGTLSILGTPVDQGGPAGIPPDGSDANGFTDDQLAGISRTFSYNDPKEPKSAGGRRRDGNVELIVRNPLAGKGAGLCAMPTKRMRGKQVDRARLGRQRKTTRRAYPPTSLGRRSATLDRFCLVGGGYVRAEYRRNRAVLLLTSSRAQRLKGLRKGSRASTVRRRLHGEKRYRVGPYDYYLAWSRHARIVVKVRRGKVVELGLADLGLTRTKPLIARFLHAFS